MKQVLEDQDGTFAKNSFWIYVWAGRQVHFQSSEN